MKYLIGASLATVLLAGAVAQAISIPVVWTSEDFNSPSYTQGEPLGDLPGWAKTYSDMHEPTIRGGSGDNQIRLWGKRASTDTGTHDYSDAWNGDGWVAVSAGVVGIVTFDLWAQQNAMNETRGDHFLIQISDQEDNLLGSVSGYSYDVKIKDKDGNILSQMSYADGGIHHNIAFKVDPIDGTVDTLLDDVSLGVQNVGTGRSLGWIYVKDTGTKTDLQDILRLDNLIAGTVPEPATLVLMGLSGSLIFRRRRA
jgi:hypothetical protein